MKKTFNIDDFPKFVDYYVLEIGSRSSWLDDFEHAGYRTACATIDPGVFELSEEEYTWFTLQWM